MTTQPLFVGVDIGGTKVAAGLVGPDGQVVFKTRAPMNTAGTAEDAMQAVYSVIRACIDESKGAVQGIGVASPGPLDVKAGIVVNPPNLPCWVNFPLAEAIRNEYRLPSHLDNDANAAGLAEALWGAGEGYDHVFYATVGTGIGTAVIIDKKLYYGRTGMAGEGGHMTVDYNGITECGCGKPGCIEGLAAGPGIARRARRKIAERTESSILKLANGDPSKVTAHEIVQAWRAGDRVATEVLSEIMDYLTIWFGNVIDLLDPEVIIVGGGLGGVVAEWFDHIRERLPKWSINPHCSKLPFVAAKFGVDAGIVGAAALCYSGPA